MKNKSANLFIKAIFAFTLVGTIFLSDSASLHADEPTTYESNFKQIDNFRYIHDLALMKKTCDKLFAKWKKIDSNHYVTLSCEACEVLSSINFHDPKQFDLAEVYALDALNSPTPKSINDQVSLVMYGLSHNISPKPNEVDEWNTKRKVKVRWWLSTWQCIDQNIIPNFDPKNYSYQLEIAPPADTNQVFFSGMSPANIKDPKLRHKYEQAIEQNKKNASIVRDQRDLRELKQTFDKIAKKFIIASYAVAPYETTELDTFLTTYIIDQPTRQEIVDAIKKTQNVP